MSLDEVCDEIFSAAGAAAAAATAANSARGEGACSKTPEAVIASYLESEARVLRASSTFGASEAVKVRLRKSLEVAEAARGLLVDSPPPPTAFFARDAMAAVNSCGGDSSDNGGISRDWLLLGLSWLVKSGVVEAVNGVDGGGEEGYRVPSDEIVLERMRSFRC